MVKASRLAGPVVLGGLVVGSMLLLVPVAYVAGRALVVEPFRIPQAGMAPELEAGSFLWAWKWQLAPERGDILVFRWPEDPSFVFVKRVIAVGGDTVSVTGHVPVVNGELASTEPAGEVTWCDTGAARTGSAHRTVTGDVGHLVLLGDRTGKLAHLKELRVPDDHYFVMGDNRPNSEDSRAWGFVPRRLVIGVGEEASFPRPVCGAPRAP